MIHPYSRDVRSFAIRGRLTSGQRDATERLWSAHGIDSALPVSCLDPFFGRSAPRVLEIGFGMGESLAKTAAARADRDFLGLEVHKPGVGSLLLLIEKLALRNLKIINADAVDIVNSYLPDNSIDFVHIYFPDPWPKRRHHKRRLVQQLFVKSIARILKPGGRLYLATDWENYAVQMLAVVNSIPDYNNLSSNNAFIDRPADRPLTRFETRGHRLGHPVWDLGFECTG